MRLNIIAKMDNKRRSLTNFGFVPIPKKKACDEASSLDTSGPSGSTDGTSASSIKHQASTSKGVSASCAAQSRPYDIGFYVGRQDVSDEEKYNVLKNCWQPDESYNFPKVRQGKLDRSFQLTWLKSFPWLAYSQAKEGAFCVRCVLFARPHVGKGAHQRAGVLVSTPLCKYKDALAELRQHCSIDSYHTKQTCVDMNNFLKCYENPGEAVINRIQSQRQKEIDENRRKIYPIIKTVIFCGRQNIAFRGKVDSGNLTTCEPEHNEGNFRALLRFRMDAGDQDLNLHLSRAPRNATYISPKIQNEIIADCGSYIMQAIVAEVRTAKFFSILADETQDISREDQFSIVVRFAKENNLFERFLTFTEVTNRTGSGLAQTLLSELMNCGIDIANMRGQGYDSCNTMSGRFSGVQAEVKKTCPLAHYLPCSSHILNLAVVHSCEIPTIRNALATMKTACKFLTASTERVRTLEQNVAELLPESAIKRVKPYCQTRFIENHSGVIRFLELLLPIVATLEKSSQGKGESAGSANELLSAICKCDFLVALTVIEYTSALLLPLSVQLQSIELDVLEAVSLVTEISEVLSDRRVNAETEFQQLFKKITDLCNKLDVDIRGPRISVRQQHRDNPPHSTPEEYYRRSVFIPYMEVLQSELLALFQAQQNECLKLQYFVPKFVQTASYSDVAKAVEMYGGDLHGPPSVVQAEFERWKKKWADCLPTDCPKSAFDAMTSCSVFAFPNISILLQIFATLPVTTCSCERTFSCLRTLKTYLRSTMSETRLNGLAHLHLNRDINIEPERILDMFARKSRRFDFVI